MRNSVVLLLCGVLLAAGCKHSPSTADSVSSENYFEAMHEGRIYVFGTEEEYKKFKDTQRAPEIRKTFVGAGPNRETVILAISKGKEPADIEFNKALEAAFKQRHGG